MAGTGEYWNGIRFTSRAQPTTWAISLSPELGKGVTGVARAFGIFILLLDQTSILELADRIRSAPPNGSCWRRARHSHWVVRTSTLRIPLLCLVFYGCGQGSFSSEADLHALDVGVYRAVLDTISSQQGTHRPTQLVVIDSTFTAEERVLIR